MTNTYIERFYSNSINQNKPLEANGIKTKSRRGNIGDTWWSRKFIENIERYYMGAQLRRGRRYARSGQVLHLDIEPGLITAQVQGTEDLPYEVKIEVTEHSKAAWKKIEAELASRALFSAQLFAGEMPQEIEEVFSAQELTLFPNVLREINSDCSCMDWENPCKHIAATYYLLAEKFDEDPFLMFVLRGRRKSQLLANLKKLRGGDRRKGEQAVEEIEDTGEPITIENFWTGTPGIVKVAPKATQRPDAILRQLGKSGIVAGNKDIIELLKPAYPIITEDAEHWAYGDLNTKRE